MKRDPFEAPDDLPPHEAPEGEDEPDWRDSASPVVRALAAALVSPIADDSPCTRRGCRGCEKSPPVAVPDLGNEPPF